MQQVNSRHRGAAALQKGRHQERGIKGAELSLEPIHFHGEMAPQGGIAAAHDQPVGESIQLGHGLLQGPGNLLNPHGRRLGRQSPGVGEHEQQG